MAIREAEGPNESPGVREQAGTESTSELDVNKITGPRLHNPGVVQWS